MNKGTHVILGLFLLAVTIVFVITNQGLFFGDISLNGGTLINLSVTNPANVEQITDIISKKAQIDVETIEVKINEQDIEMRFDIVHTKVMAAIEHELDAEFGDTVHIKSYSVIGKSEKLLSYYLVYSGALLMFFISGILIVSGIGDLIKERRSTIIDIKPGI